MRADDRDFFVDDNSPTAFAPFGIPNYLTAPNKWPIGQVSDPFHNPTGTASPPPSRRITISTEQARTGRNSIRTELHQGDGLALDRNGNDWCFIQAYDPSLEKGQVVGLCWSMYFDPANPPSSAGWLYTFELKDDHGLGCFALNCDGGKFQANIRGGAGQTSAAQGDWYQRSLYWDDTGLRGWNETRGGGNPTIPTGKFTTGVWYDFALIEYESSGTDGWVDFRMAKDGGPWIPIATPENGAGANLRNAYSTSGVASQGKYMNVGQYRKGGYPGTCVIFYDEIRRKVGTDRKTVTDALLAASPAAAPPLVPPVIPPIIPVEPVLPPIVCVEPPEVEPTVAPPISPLAVILIDAQIAAWTLWAKTPSLAKASKVMAATHVAALKKYKAGS